jgi:hypothetical protein
MTLAVDCAALGPNLLAHAARAQKCCTDPVHVSTLTQAAQCLTAIGAGQAQNATSAALYAQMAIDVLIAKNVALAAGDVTGAVLLESARQNFLNLAQGL